MTFRAKSSLALRILGVEVNHFPASARKRGKRERWKVIVGNEVSEIIPIFYRRKGQTQDAPV